MYDPVRYRDAAHDAFGDPLPARGGQLIRALELWTADQPIGRRVHTSDIAREVCRYAEFKTWDAHGPNKCARILETSAYWRRNGSWLTRIGIGDAKALGPGADGVAAWIAAECPGRATAKEHAAAYNAWAATHNYAPQHPTMMAHHLRDNGYVVVARPNNRAVYARMH